MRFQHFVFRNTFADKSTLLHLLNKTLNINIAYFPFSASKYENITCYNWRKPDLILWKRSISTMTSSTMLTWSDKSTKCCFYQQQKQTTFKLNKIVWIINHYDKRVVSQLQAVFVLWHHASELKLGFFKWFHNYRYEMMVHSKLVQIYQVWSCHSQWTDSM